MIQETGFLFDLDGVIIDSESEYSRIWHEINIKFPTGVDNLEYVIKGCTLTNILNNYFPENIHENVMAELYRMEGLMTYNYCDGAESFLKLLKSRGLPAVLVTSSNSDKMAHLYEQHPEIKDYFKAVVTADMITRSKPDPEGYLLGAELAGVCAGKCYVFEDSLQGVKAGRDSGAKVVGIYGTLGRSAIEQYCDLTVGSLAELDPASVGL